MNAIGYTLLGFVAIAVARAVIKLLLVGLPVAIVADVFIRPRETFSLIAVSRSYR